MHKKSIKTLQKGREMTDNDEQWASEHIRAIKKCKNRGGGKTNPKQLENVKAEASSANCTGNYDSWFYPHGCVLFQEDSALSTDFEGSLNGLRRGTFR